MRNEKILESILLGEIQERKVREDMPVWGDLFLLNSKFPRSFIPGWFTDHFVAGITG